MIVVDTFNTEYNIGSGEVIRVVFGETGYTVLSGKVNWAHAYEDSTVYRDSYTRWSWVEGSVNWTRKLQIEGI